MSTMVTVTIQCDHESPFGRCPNTLVGAWTVQSVRRGVACQPLMLRANMSAFVTLRPPWSSAPLKEAKT